MLDDYTNQSLTWKHVTSTDATYNKDTYTTSTIKGRKENGTKLVTDSKGQQIVSTACVFTESIITERDLIDNRLVIAVDEDVDLDGVIQGYEVYLK